MATYSKNPWNPWNPWISYMTFSHIIAGWWFFATPLNKKKSQLIHNIWKTNVPNHQPDDGLRWL
jgi:hypothetical protein